MRLSTEGHGVVVSEHRLEQLVPAATGLVLVRGGTLEQADPTTWRPPSRAPRAERPTSPGPGAWSLDGVEAGFQGRPVLAGVDLPRRAGGGGVRSGAHGGGR